MYKPTEEGITHINAYSKSRTRLGYLLSNFTRSQINTEDGIFQSIESYWYWLLLPNIPQKESLRQLHGWNAKSAGRELCQTHKRSEWGDSEEFRTKICRAIDLKIEALPELKRLLTNNTLPIVHYYVYGGVSKIPESGEWIWNHYNQWNK